MNSSGNLIFLASAEETASFGKKIAAELEDKRLVIFLSGDLGAGKTTFAQGFIKYLFGEKTEVLSPTYAYVHRYQNDHILYHFDFYRIDSHEQVYELGLDDSLYDTRAIRLVEWPEKIAHLGVEPDIFIHLENSNNGRHATISYPDKD